MLRLGAVALLAMLPALAFGKQSPGCFPLLSDGLHITSGYSDPQNASAMHRAREAWGDVLQAGTVDTWQVGLAWNQVEAFPGEINTSYVADIMQSLHRVGYRPLLGLHAMDGRLVTVPRDLAHPKDPTSLRPGLTWDDPTLQKRYFAMLKVVMPLAGYYGTFHLNVGSEVDLSFNGRKGEVGAAFAKFVGAAREYVNTITTPDMSVGASLTFQGMAAAQAEEAQWLPALVRVSSNTPITYEPSGAPGAVTAPMFDVVKMLTTLLPSDMCLAILGLAFPSSPPSTDGSPTALSSTAGFTDGEAAQAEFMDNFIRALQIATLQYPRRVRFLGGGHFVDRTLPVCEYLAAAQGLKGEVRSAFLSHHCSLGLLYPDGTPKPALASFLAGMRALAPPPPTADVWR